MPCAHVAGQFLLEGRNLGAHDVLAVVQYGFDAPGDPVANPLLL